MTSLLELRKRLKTPCAEMERFRKRIQGKVATTGFQYEGSQKSRFEKSDCKERDDAHFDRFIEQELGSDERRAANQSIREHAEAEAVSQRKSVLTASSLQCGQRACTFYQLQTRSADEPMTTFVTVSTARIGGSFVKSHLYSTINVIIITV